MSNTALPITEVQEQSPRQIYLAYSNTVTPSAVLERPSHMPLITSALVILQVLDGALTYSGMRTFGLAAEGNPLLRGLMNTMGILPGIALMKMVCIAIVLALCAQAHRISWLPAALTCIAGIYTVAAVLPWSWLLVTEYLL